MKKPEKNLGSTRNQDLTFAITDPALHPLTELIKATGETSSKFLQFSISYSRDISRENI